VLCHGAACARGNGLASSFKCRRHALYWASPRPNEPGVAAVREDDGSAALVPKPERVCELANQVVGDNAVDLDTSLLDIGMDSIALAELRALLRDAFQCQLTTEMLLNHPTARQISIVLAETPTSIRMLDAQTIERMAEVNFDEVCPMLHRLKSGVVDKVPLFALPAVTGASFYFQNIGRAIESDLYVTQWRFLTSGQKDDIDIGSMATLADGFAQVILEECARRSLNSFDLIGLSFGGMLTHQVAMASKDAGGARPAKLVLIDPVPPAPWKTFRTEMASSLAWAARYYVYLLTNMTSTSPSDLQASLDALDGLPNDSLLLQVYMLCARLGICTLSAESFILTTREIQVLQSSYRLTGDFVMARDEATVVPNGDPHGYTAPYPGPMLLVLAKERVPFFTSIYSNTVEDSSFEHAQSYGTDVTTVMVDGDHLDACRDAYMMRDEAFKTALEAFELGQSSSAAAEMNGFAKHDGARSEVADREPREHSRGGAAQTGTIRLARKRSPTITWF